jgi:hypothetical protein
MSALHVLAVVQEGIRDYGDDGSRVLGVFDTFASMCAAADAPGLAGCERVYVYAVVPQPNVCCGDDGLDWVTLVTPREAEAARQERLAEDRRAAAAAERRQRLADARQRELDARVASIRATVARANAGTPLSPAAPLDVVEHVGDAMHDLDMLAHPERPFHAEKLPALRRRLALHAASHDAMRAALQTAGGTASDLALLDKVALQLRSSTV